MVDGASDHLSMSLAGVRTSRRSSKPGTTGANFDLTDRVLELGEARRGNYEEEANPLLIDAVPLSENVPDRQAGPLQRLLEVLPLAVCPLAPRWRAGHLEVISVLTPIPSIFKTRLWTLHSVLLSWSHLPAGSGFSGPTGRVTANSQWTCSPAPSVGSRACCVRSRTWSALRASMKRADGRPASQRSVNRHGGIRLGYSRRAFDLSALLGKPRELHHDWFGGIVRLLAGDISPHPSYTCLRSHDLR